jgi:hypothetical protein
MTSKEKFQTRIGNYIEHRVKRGMNPPENVAFKVDEIWASAETPWMRYGICVKIIVDDVMYFHAVKNKGQLTKMETAEEFLKLAVDKLQEWCRKRTGEALVDRWYAPPKPKSRKL